MGDGVGGIGRARAEMPKSRLGVMVVVWVEAPHTVERLVRIRPVPVEKTRGCPRKIHAPSGNATLTASPSTKSSATQHARHRGGWDQGQWRRARLPRVRDGATFRRDCMQTSFARRADQLHTDTVRAPRIHRPLASFQNPSWAFPRREVETQDVVGSCRGPNAASGGGGASC